MEQLAIIDEQQGALPVSPVYPAWATEIPRHNVPILTISLEPARRAVEIVKKRSPSLFDSNEDHHNGNGQKNTQGEDWVDCPFSNEGGIITEGATPHIVRHPNWWRRQDQARARTEKLNRVPRYAIYPISVIERGLEKEKREIVSLPNQPQSAGSELEFAVAIFTRGAIQPLNIQAIIQALKGSVPVSIEGWVSQLEHPSRPKTQGLAVTDHRQTLISDLSVISEVLALFDAYLLPISTMPFNPAGQPNFEDPHVRNVLTQGMQVALGRKLTLEDAAGILETYGVNGLHITVELKGDKDGNVGDERLLEVFKLTHTPITVLLKALTLSGNLESLRALIQERLSCRDEKRLTLPTARVGEVARLYDPKTIAALKQGIAPSLERASLCDENGKAAAGVHNPLGRPKETGRIEFTIFDVEPNVDKIIALEVLMSLWTTLIDKALLENKLDLLKQKLNPLQVYLFTEFLHSQNDFIALSQAIETNGIRAQFTYEFAEGHQETYSAGQMIIEFIKWVTEKSIETGIATQDSEEIHMINWLRDNLHRQSTGQTAQSFDQYFNPNNDRYGVGTVAEIAKIRFIQLTTEQQKEPEEAYQLVIKELAQSYRNYLQELCT